MKPDCPVKRHWHTSNHPVFCNPRLSSPTSAVLGSEAALVILQERRRLDAINGSDTTSCETPFMVLEQGRGLNLKRDRLKDQWIVLLAPSGMGLPYAINCSHSTCPHSISYWGYLNTAMEKTYGLRGPLHGSQAGLEPLRHQSQRHHLAAIWSVVAYAWQLCWSRLTSRESSLMIFEQGRSLAKTNKLSSQRMPLLNRQCSN